MYTIELTEQKVESFLEAVKIAMKLGSKVLDNNGLVRWEPAKKVTAKQKRMYQERLSAWKAYQGMK